MSEDSGSLYDQFSSHDAPKQPKKREEGWQQNREDNTTPYVNRDMPRHAIETMTIEQKNFSYYEFDNLVFGRNPHDSFGNKVNAAFGGKPKGSFDFRAEKKRYQALYRNLMESNDE